ncbi:murein L,D-transpeptidase catalytic domain family protein [Fulvivirga maritima]|uniref:murein L,D-transpeptidase catalytic domain family protein n=1 Tax=Fulvivirga maritima TaxID=2904247 RepID=UPI001F1964C9|nr:murein L,D-transpeptidase catalytic domain family protein [Fulvivirga maritima]UII27235.1 murein L,D-transpeptidase catalytic domain family protein [Fulvivirga maritima]
MIRRTILSFLIVVLVPYSSLFANIPVSEKSKALASYIENNYALLKTTGPKPEYELFKKGLIGYLNLKKQNKLSESGLLTLIDFRMSSNKKRLWIIDLKTHEVLYHTLVAHGRNSGNEFAKKFSNVPNSNTSSLGFYVTGETYSGKHGLSLRLDGVEAGFNNNARDRAIVMHGANYVDKSFTKNYGRLGRSFGCPSIPMGLREEIIPLIAEKSCLFIYYPDNEYLQNSNLINEEVAYEAIHSVSYLL